MPKKTNIIIKLDPAKPTKAYDTYWKFAYERQNVFYNRLNNYEPYTLDSILKEYKFTNVYRACDRVSQFLIKEVIYKHKGDLSHDDLLLRIFLFKLFNKIETWQLLENKFGEITTTSFKVSAFKKFLDGEMNRGRTLYSNAYMMASGCKEFDVTRKHHAHLMLLDMMLKDNLADKIASCKKMREAYSILLEYPLIGRFLAYQYVTDLNYSTLTDFEETEFTIPGPGARDGIKKCFSKLGGLSETEIIKMMSDRQELEFERLGLDFKRIGDRPLQYIDIQNIFCEVDKYCRVAHPDLLGFSGRTRIKQRFKPNDDPIKYFFPPKWKVKLGR
ncbi:nucleotide kinase domain-containing protein [Agarilytica rhodophyticola]|uniref:nucleotide kinase domain-containing protein n=1 Tax=Agarilytica rhodophyticola TaxID=1737490 RepID=UPI000B34545B|nr:nucleotide kinase domain-containing protein [Agarilytica rhodophyticola]